METRTKTTTVTKTIIGPKQNPLPTKEEQILRMRRGLMLVNDHPLEPKTKDEALLAQLREIEASLFLQANQVRGMRTKEQIIHKLKNR